MTKKDYILKMLTLLENTRDLAKGLKLVVETNTLDDGILDILINTFQITAKNMTNETTKKSLQKGAEFLEKIKKMETESIIQDQKDIAQLDQMIKDI